MAQPWLLLAWQPTGVDMLVCDCCSMLRTCVYQANSYSILGNKAAGCFKIPASTGLENPLGPRARAPKIGAGFLLQCHRQPEGSQLWIFIIQPFGMLQGNGETHHQRSAFLSIVQTGSKPESPLQPSLAIS
jgi:hypothetical protein